MINSDANIRLFRLGYIRYGFVKFFICACDFRFFHRLYFDFSRNSEILTNTTKQDYTKSPFLKPGWTPQKPNRPKTD